MAGRRAHVRRAAQPRARSSFVTAEPSPTTSPARVHGRRRRTGCPRREARLLGGRTRYGSCRTQGADPAGAVREPLRGRRVCPREAVLVLVESCAPWASRGTRIAKRNHARHLDGGGGATRLDLRLPFPPTLVNARRSPRASRLLQRALAQLDLIAPAASAARQARAAGPLVFWTAVLRGGAPVRREFR